MKYIIRRGQYPSETYIPDNGEMIYAMKTKQFFIGDGINTMVNLKPFNNVVMSDSGKVFLVRIDENDNPIIKPYIQKDLKTNEICEFYASTKEDLENLKNE